MRVGFDLDELRRSLAGTVITPQDARYDAVTLLQPLVDRRPGRHNAAGSGQPPPEGVREPPLSETIRHGSVDASHPSVSRPCRVTWLCNNHQSTATTSSPLGDARRLG